MELIVTFSKVSDGNCRFAGKANERRQAANNRKEFLRQFNLCADSLISTYPSPPTVRRIRSGDSVKRPRVQALVTQRLNTPLGIVSADCLPILLADEGRTTIGAVHFGRSFIKEPFLEAVVAEMQRTAQGRVEAFLGPCLQSKSHRLDSRSVSDLMNSRSGISQCFTSIPHSSDFNFDYSGCSADILRSLGVHIRFRSRADSYSNPQYFSRRRRIETDPTLPAQLNISIICLKK